MSEKILKALMQLFAIIARPQVNDSDRRAVVEAFLRRQLNEELVKTYMGFFDEFYQEAQEKQKKSTQNRRTAAIAVRVLKICNDINDQLTQDQKIIVLVQLLEFCRSESNEVSELELEFIQAVFESFNVDPNENRLIKSFVLNSFGEIPASPGVLVIDNAEKPEHHEYKHLQNRDVKGQIWVLYVHSASMYFVRFTHTGELYMNGQLLQEDKVYPFNPGSSLRDPKSSPIYYSDVIKQFFKEELSASRVVYKVDQLEYRFRSGKIGIHPMSFEEESGRMVGIMGASGAGKSTLLSVLNGINKPFSGKVSINGTSIHEQSESVKGLIGYVSQDDLLIEELTVFENLYYNAKLCFDNLSEEEIRAKVDITLRNLGLYEIRDMKVGSPLNKKISGGQRKRLNISLELIREPSIMFLDEPTSGLSSRDSENILDLLKELALKGKLLFVVIHQPSSDIFKMFDRLIILDTGGHLIYNGNPIESIVYFKTRIHHANYNESECHVCGNVNPEQIFNIVEARVLDEYGQPTSTRKISPPEWSEHYKKFLLGKEEPLDEGKGIPEINFKTPGKLKQFVVFVKRDVLSKLSDTQYLIITLLESPVLALFLAFLIKYFNKGTTNAPYTLRGNENLPVYIFMSVIVSIFMGLTVSAEEIIKDRKILKREAFLNLSWNSYLMSKVSVQFVISAIQAFTFVLVGNLITQIHGMWFQYWLVLFSCWASANMLGLVISDSFKAVVTIYILIPFLVIPQIILSGVMVKYEKLNPNLTSPVAIPFYGEFITARWGYEALAVEQYVNNKYEKKFYQYDQMVSQADYYKLYWCTELTGRLENLNSNFDKLANDPQLQKDLSLVSYEVNKYLASKPDSSYSYGAYLVPGRINPEIIARTRELLDKVKKYNIRLSNWASTTRDNLKEKMKAVDNEGFNKLINQNTNDKLEEFVKNRNEMEKILSYMGRLYQKGDPIFRYPEHPFIRAHFYAPRKNIFGIPVDTYVVNVIVLWLMTILLYLALYFRALKKLLDSGEILMGNSKGSD
ncbi:MAG TPA: ATP-binding cassette domain-containing protein [Bacteroidales bacterium]|nr:ATP-binding cassette domain-containing protein [Bacteroidales bacterium]